MKRKIDCILIGYNEFDFVLIEKRFRMMGEDSGAYRKLNLGFIDYKSKPHTARDILDLPPYNTMFKTNPFNFSNMFSGTIAYLGTYLAKQNYTFDYVNSFSEEKEYLVDILKNSDVVCIAIITTLYMDFFPVLEIIQFIKKYNTNTKIIVGGPFIYTKVRDLKKEKLNMLFEIIGADIYVNSFQGETALINIISALKSNRSIQNIRNIYYSQNGIFIANETNDENNKLADNIVNWDLFSDRLKNIVPVRTSASCPFNCAFCSYPLNKKKYDILKVELIEKELKTLSAINPNLHLTFIDDTLNIPRKRFKEFLIMMKKNKFKFTWDCNLRCQFVNDEIVKMMADCGCIGVYLGIESASQIILDNMNKKVNIADLVRGQNLFNRYNIPNCASFIIGFPGETLETVECTRRFIVENGPTFYQLHVWYYEPHTPVWNQRNKYGLHGLYFNWEHNTMDITRAFDLIDKLFISITNSIWLSPNGYEYYGIFELRNRGVELKKIKEFITAFNKDIKNKIERKPPLYYSLDSPFD